MTKQEVIDRQKELNKHGANLDVNGYWGPLTEAANKKFMMRDPDYTPTPYVRYKGTYYPENSEINAIIDLTTGETRFVDSPPPLPPKPSRIGAGIKKVGGVIAGLPRLLPKPYGIGASIKKVGGVIAGLPRLLPNISKAKGKGTYYLEDNGLHIPIDLTTGKTRFVDSPPNIPKPAVQQHPLTSSVKLSSLPPTPYVRNKGTYYPEDGEINVIIDLTTGKARYVDSPPPLPPKPSRIGAGIKKVGGIIAGLAKLPPKPSRIGAGIKRVGGAIAGLPKLLSDRSRARGKGVYYSEDGDGLDLPIYLDEPVAKLPPKPSVQQHPLTPSVKLSSLSPMPYVKSKRTYYPKDNGINIPIDLTTGKGWYAESLPPLPPKPYRRGAGIKGVIAPLVLAGIAAAYAKKQPDVSSGILSGMGYYYDTKKAAAEAAKAQEDKERLLAIEYGYKETAAKTLARAALDKGIKAFAAKQDEYFNKQLDDYASKGRTYPDKVLLQKGISPERIAALKGIAAEARKQAVYNRTFKRIPSEKKEPLAVKQAWTRLNKVDERIKQQEKTLAMYLSELSPEGLVIYNKDRVTTGQLPLKVFTPGKYIPGKWGKPGEAYYLNKESAEYYIDKGGIPKGTEIYVNGDPIGKVE